MADAVTTSGSFYGNEENRAFIEKARSLAFQASPKKQQTTRDEHGNDVTEHRDGRVDVQINVTEPARIQPVEE